MIIKNVRIYFTLALGEFNLDFRNIFQGLLILFEFILLKSVDFEESQNDHYQIRQ